VEDRLSEPELFEHRNQMGIGVRKSRLIRHDLILGSLLLVCAIRKWCGWTPGAVVRTNPTWVACTANGYGGDTARAENPYETTDRPPSGDCHRWSSKETTHARSHRRGRFSLPRGSRHVERACDYPVDIEFTTNFLPDGSFRINLVQCRPFQVKGGAP
jgi:hypothetical protein